MSLPKFNGNVSQLGNEISYTDEVPFEIPFEGDANEIDYVYSGCQACTLVKIDRENNKIYGSVKVPNAGIPQSPGTHNLIKTFSVCFDPDQPEFVANEDGTRIGNELKRILVIQLRGKVIVPESTK